jgi:CubicO group peptidase (beta-lactamase class C family)
MAAGFDELDAKIQAAMDAHAIPGVALAVVTDGHEYVKGYGITNVDHPVPVDGDTVFRIGSTTRTFTGTVAMRLVDEGRVDLDAPVRRYLPDFAVADPDASAEVTVRQLLNHTPGWLGDNLRDFGRGDDALARYVASMTQLPQLTLPALYSLTTMRVWWLPAASSRSSPDQPTKTPSRSWCSNRSDWGTPASSPTRSSASTLRLPTR